MKSSRYIRLTSLLLLSAIALSSVAQSSFTVDSSNSPFYILNDTTIARGDTLTFGPGANVFLGDSVDVQVEGVLQIAGDTNNLVFIRPINSNVGWGEFKIYIHVDSLIVENAYVEGGRFLSFNTINHFSNVELVNNQRLQWNEAIARFVEGELVFENCRVQGSNAGEGILVHSMDNPQVLNCYFRAVPDAVEFLNCTYGRIGNNEFYDLNDDAIDLNNCFKTVVDSNLIVNVSNRGMEIGSENFGSSQDILVYRNILVNCFEGVNFKEGSTGLIKNNTFHNNRTGVTSIADGRPNVGSSVTVLNSIFHENDVPIFEDDSSTITVSYSSSSSIFLAGDSNIFVNPDFADVSNLDYSLKKTSPCIDAGQRDGALDLDGTYSDLGAIFFYQDTVSSIIENTSVKLELMPNPVINRLHIKTDVEVNKVEVFNNNGQLVKQKSIAQRGSSKFYLNMEELPGGLYIIVISNEKHRTQGKFVKL